MSKIYKEIKSSFKKSEISLKIFQEKKDRKNRGEEIIKDMTPQNYTAHFQGRKQLLRLKWLIFFPRIMDNASPVLSYIYEMSQLRGERENP